MSQVIGVRFKKAGKIYYFDPKDIVRQAAQVFRTATHHSRAGKD